MLTGRACRVQVSASELVLESGCRLGGFLGPLRENVFGFTGVGAIDPTLFIAASPLGDHTPA